MGKGRIKHGLVWLIISLNYFNIIDRGVNTK